MEPIINIKDAINWAKKYISKYEKGKFPEDFWDSPSENWDLNVWQNDDKEGADLYPVDEFGQTQVSSPVWSFKRKIFPPPSWEEVRDLPYGEVEDD